MPSKPRARIARCPVCGNDFRAIKDQNGRFNGKIRLQKYCSKDCWSRRSTIYISCGYCGKEVKTTKSENKQYCDMECRDNGYKYKTGEDAGAWKGDKASYSAIHKWLYSHYKKSDVCDHCKRQGYTEWANISQEYHRERDDWLNLCKSCHFKFDGENHKNFRRYK